MFSLPAGQHYLNCASYSPLLKSSEEAAYEAIRRKVNPALTIDGENQKAVETMRKLVGRLVNASPERVAFVPSVSYGVAIAVANTELAAGQNVVVPGGEFPSNVYGWMDRCKAVGAELRLVSQPGDAAVPGAAWNDSILEAIDAQTAVVAATPLHWTDGILFDLERIGARAREVGAAFLVDGSQAVGAMPFDFEAVQPDLLFCVGYKWCLGPKGYGFIVVGDRYLGGRPIELSWMSREGAEDRAGLTSYKDGFQPGARRFDVGEHDNAVATGILTAAYQQLLDWGVENIQRYCAGLAAHVDERLADTGYTLALPSERAAHLFGIRLPDASRLAALREELNRRGIFVSVRGTSLRVSPNVYNTPEDMEALTEALLSFRK